MNCLRLCDFVHRYAPPRIAAAPPTIPTGIPTASGKMLAGVGEGGVYTETCGVEINRVPVHKIPKNEHSSASIAEMIKYA